MQHTLECVSLTGQKGYFGFPSAKLGPPFMAQSIFYFIYFAISPAPCCVYFLKNGQMQHFSCRTFTAVVSQKTNKCTTNVHHPVRIFVTDCAAKQKLCLSLCKKLQEMKNIKFCQIMKQTEAGTGTEEEALLILARKELFFFVPLYFRNFLKLVLNNFIQRSHNYRLH